MFKSKFWLTVFFVYQAFSTALIAIGVWPKEIIYLNLGLQLAAVCFFNLENAIYSVVLSTPFYLVIPNSKFDSFSAWRIVFPVLFLVFLFKDKNYFQNGLQKKIEFFKWDKYLKYLFYILLLSIALADNKIPGLKKIAFGANIYLLYVVIFNVVKTKEQILSLIKTSFVATGAIVLFGFAQLFSSAFGNIYYFWQYWATFPARFYYGTTFADTALYSNSWFTATKGAWSLRMFSILPDSHAFAVIAMFSIPFASMLLFFAKSNWQKALYWIYIALAMLAISFSGTRGVWVGILAPVFILGYLYAKHFGREIIKPIAKPFLIFFIVLALSPFIQNAINHLGKGNADFLQRAETIYDLNESSNAGRIKIWKDTLKLSLAHPLLGVGYGNFQLSVSDQQSKALNLPKQYITAHSQYFDILAEAGLVGLIFFLLYLENIGKIFWQFFKSHYLFFEDGFVFFVICFAAYFIWLFAYSLFDGTIMNDRVLMFFFIDLAIAGNIIKIYSRENIN
ncbi:MAG: hypothetical protein JWO40_508 [Candidatus Doudnabacteria bacterium]|nr:hypothetical protein [Candidatus Doudnabacteria bacterium]